MIWSMHQRDELELAVAERGFGSAVYFQHGLCGAAAQPEEVFPLVGGWRLVTLECRGHGGSPAGDERALSIKTFTDDLVALIERRETPPVVVGGISMGAAIAMRLAVARPDLVRGLVIARPAWLTSMAPKNMRSHAVVGDLLRRFGSVEGLRRFEKSKLAARLAREAPDNLATLRGLFGREPLDTTRELLLRISADGPAISEGELGKLRVRTLVIGHGRDVVHPLTMARKVAELIPGARLVEIAAKADDRRRYVEEFRNALGAFLEELTP